MAKKITIDQLRTAFRTAPEAVKEEGELFIVRAISEVKRVAVQGAPWRVGQSGGGIPRLTGNLREQHYTKISSKQGTFGVSPKRVPYALRVHHTRPWLDYARQTADKKVEKHYNTFADAILKHIAT